MSTRIRIPSVPAARASSQEPHEPRAESLEPAGLALRCLLALAVAIALPALAGAQSAGEAGLPMLRNYTGKDFGFTSVFFSVAQDRRGVMYFGASLLYEYDGVTWRASANPDSNSSRLVAIDDGGRVWVGGNAAFGYWEPGPNGSMKYVSLLDRIPVEHRAFNAAQQVVPTAQGVFVRFNERLFRWDGNRMQVWKPQTRFEGLSEVRGRIYVFQNGVGLQELVGDELRNLPGGDAWKNSRQIRLHPYDDRRFLVTSQGEPLMLYDGEHVTPFPTQADEYLKQNELFTTSPLPDGGFCLTTRRGGAVLIGHDGQLRRIINQEAGLPTQTVNAAFTDRDGSLWLAHSVGITRVEFDSPISILSRSAFSDARRHNGTLYVSSSQAGRALFRLVPNQQTGIPALQQIPSGTIGGGFLLPIQDPTGIAPAQLLVGTGVGVMTLDGDTLSPAVPGSQGPNQAVARLLQSSKLPSRVFVGHGNGLSAIRREGDKWIDEGRLPSFSNSVALLAEDADGTLWVGGNAGVMRIDVPASGWQDAKVERLGEREGLEKGAQDILLLAGHIFASGSSQDVRRWDPSTRMFVPDKRFFLPLKNSVFDSARGLLNGDVWSQNRAAFEQRFGLFRRQADGSHVLEEDRFRRLSPFVIRNALAEPDGVLWLMGDDGLFRFDQNMKASGKPPYSVLVRRVSAGPEDTVYDGSGLPSDTASRLAYARNSLRFEFAAPTFTDDTGANYQYLLEGADRDWSSWGKVTEAHYSSLGPGDYRFRVRARNLEGLDSEEGAFLLTILPPWYRTWWAYAVYVLALVAMALLVDRFQRRRLILREREKSRHETETLEAQARVLEATVAERTREISERAAQLATVNRITQALSSQLDKDQLIQLVGDQIRDVFRASIAYVSLLDRATMMLRFPYQYGEEIQPRPFGEGLTSQIIRSGQPLLINEDLEVSTTKLGLQNIGRNAASYLGVPISSGGETIGVVSVQSTEEEGRFTEADQKLLSTIATSVGVAFHNAQLFEEARQARAAAEEADEAKSTFLSTVSHELRTPLTSVLGFAKIIRKRLDERLFPLIPEDDRKVAQAKKQVSDNLDVVVSEGERLTKLINDVLDLAKIQAGKITWHMTALSVADVIERAIAATSSLIDAKKLELVQAIEPGLPNVTGDSDRLIQVVINLISNAVKFTDAGSVICAAKLVKGELVVSVTDSGIGIAPEDQPKVFERFKQVGDTLTDKPEGTGLGLPISKEIIEHHRGRMWVESEPGKGSTFFFSLPVQAGAQAAATPRALHIETLIRQLRENVASHEVRPRSILVVDDDAHIRSVLQQEFTEAGYAVRLAENGRHALAMIREERPGLVVLDVMMPEMNGFDVAAVLKNDPATMDIPIIILSIVEDKERGFRLGVDRYLTKPIDTEALLREVDTLLDQGKSRKKVMVVDEDASTVRTLTEVLETRGYHVMESNGAELVSKAVAAKPDIIVLSSLLSSTDSVRSLRFEKGLENVLFLIYQQEQ